jgi:hypothetical protein
MIASIITTGTIAIASACHKDDPLSAKKDTTKANNERASNVTNDGVLFNMI